MAAKAIERVDSHERFCSERYDRINNSLTRIETGVEGVHARVSEHQKNINANVLKVGGAIIACLVGATGFLVVKVLAL